MPPSTYMVIDPRQDHSIRIQQPDLSVELGVPKPCNNCHQDKSPEWAIELVAARWLHVSIQKSCVKFHLKCVEVE